MALHLQQARNTPQHWIVCVPCGVPKVLVHLPVGWDLHSFGTYHPLHRAIRTTSEQSLFRSPFANGATFLGFEMAMRVLDKL